MSRDRRIVAIGLAVVAVLGLAALLLGSEPAEPARVEADAGADRSSRATQPDQSDQPDQSVGTTTQRPARRASPTSTTAPAGRPVTLAFAGDVHFEGMIRPQLDANPGGLLAPIAPLLADADLAVVNLETAITDGGTPSAKEYNFRAPARAFDALKGAGVDIASMANNHGLDYGTDGLADSLAAASGAGVPLIGIGADDAAAYAPHIAEVHGSRIAVIGATQVLDNSLITAWTAGPGKPGLASAKDVARLVEAVRAARSEADTVVVFLHWGVEKATCPSGDQQALARTLVDAGADVIVGGHAHRLQGAGRLGDALVAYGLGNFVFYTPSGPGTDSGVLRVTVQGRTVQSYSWEPARISNGIPRPLAGAEAEAARSAWGTLRGCTGLAA